MFITSPATLCSFAWLGQSRATIEYAYVTQDIGHNSWNFHSPAICAISLFPILLLYSSALAMDQMRPPAPACTLHWPPG